MDKLEIKGDWNILKGKFKQRFGKLMGNEMQSAKGRVEELVGRIEKRTARAKRAVEQAVRDYHVPKDVAEDPWRANKF